MYYKKILAAALTVSCIGGIVPANSVQAASLKIRYSGKTRYYKGKQLHVSYANKNLSSKYVGIQINKVNMIPYYDYLVKQGPKVKRTYSKSSGKLILKNGDDTLTAYVGKRTYYLNGVKKTFSVAPTKVKYYKTKKTIILIPANAIVKGLGLNYKYSSSSKRIYITQPVIPSDSTTQVQTQPSGSVQYTNYNKSLSAYVTAEKKQHPTYGGKSISTSTYTSYIDPSKDTTNNFQFLTLDTYREVDPTAYNNLLNSKLRSNSVLRNKGNVLIAAAKQYNIDPVYLLCQTILETGYGTSTLSQGKAITTVVSGSSVVRDNSGNVTGFKTVNGKYKTSTISKKTVYNLYGIKAYDSDPQLCGFSYAYYQGWTSVDAAIYGAAEYVSQNYIHNQTYHQNTLYKFRYNPNINYLWHEYATDPSYAKQIATIMYSQFRSVYRSDVSFTYDKPQFN